MLARGLVHVLGGWWRQRQQIGTGPWGRLMLALYHANMREHGSDIAKTATFAGPPRFPHGPTGVFIAPGTAVGRNVTIYQHVHLARSEEGGESPTIGDDVLIGAGAIVMGGIHVGDGAKIGAGARVVHDVPAGATAVSPAARVVVHQDDAAMR